MADTASVGFKPETRVEALLSELCVTYGYCLSDEETAAEGRDPALLDRQERHVLVDVVRR